LGTIGRARLPGTVIIFGRPDYLIEHGRAQHIAALRTDVRAEIATLRSELLSFMKWGFGLILSAMFILVGFILWDRRSTVKPVRDQIDELERQKVDRLIAAMKELSGTDANLARVLRSVGLL